ncbi:CMP-N-acetylneuraminate-beta-galactosamide-alpha-2,3-sialyltransferase 2-like [Gadus chalcogrammus]|uniref:CMP-N-acetylneuraminate-beta-galactosamide- alpha-2,3-sialyltransferase 2-like n=1 Tax=Gadus chalcogrammus TaxID=1042646 RepID=UPI0024C47972|nr:CMP-N-acetylneuraminate-beta-galactosamide-alpha-2,3-sialyltransferase 2-like [Gadus chalcogrammus]
MAVGGPRPVRHAAAGQTPGLGRMESLGRGADQRSPLAVGAQALGERERRRRGRGGGVRCSRRACVLLSSLAVVFLTSLFFSVSLRGAVGFNYLEAPGWEESRRVKLVPSYAGARRPALPADSAGGGVVGPPKQRTCACPRCVGDPGVSDWFDENYEPDIAPVWTKDNIELPSDVYYWWVMLQPQFKPHSIHQVLLRLFQVCILLQCLSL